VNARVRTRRFVVLVDDEEIPVEVQLQDDGALRYTVGKIEGEASVAVAHGGHALLFQMQEKVVAARIAHVHETFHVATREHSLTCKVYPESRFLAARLQGRSGGAKGALLAQMPGRVVRLMVSEGDRVEQGEGVLILEAMKMENEVRAPISGTIKGVFVVEGGDVKAGELMVEVGCD
jgi:biotin carboxyl carrier protein